MRATNFENRQQFEAFIRSDAFFAACHDERAMERDPSDNGYFDAHIDGAWRAWNAARNQPTTLPVKAAHGVQSIEWQGITIIVHPAFPPHIWDAAKQEMRRIEGA